MIQIIPTEQLDDKESQRIMESIETLSQKILKHDFGLSYAGTGNLYYSILSLLEEKFKKIPRISQFFKNYSEEMLKQLINKGKVPIFYPPDWVYTKEQLRRAIFPWSQRYAEYPWAIYNSKLNQSMKILDVGAGSSLFPLYLAQLGHEVSVIDNDKILMTNITPKFNKWTGLKVDYELGDATKIQFSDNTFDRVFCISVLEHLEEEVIDGKLVNLHKLNLDVKAISEMLRVLKPGGLLILTLDWSENPNENRSYSLEDIYARVLSPFHSNLLEDTKPTFEWKIQKEKNQKAWKSRYPFYFSLDGWAIGILLQK